MIPRPAIAAILLSLAACSGTAPQEEKLPGKGAGPSIAASEAPTTSLNGLLDFRSPSDCEASAALSRILEELADYDDETGRPSLGRLEAGPVYRSAFGEPVASRNESGLNVEVPLQGRWHGLPVAALIVDYWNGGDPPSLSVRLDATQAELIAMLNRNGFSLPPGGAQEIDGEGYSRYIEVEAMDSGAVFRCYLG